MSSPVSPWDGWCPLRVGRGIRVGTGMRRGTATDPCTPADGRQRVRSGGLPLGTDLGSAARVADRLAVPFQAILTGPAS